MDIKAWMSEYLGDVHVYKVTRVYDKETAERVTTEFVTALKNEKIVLWGAGTVGRIFYSLLKELGLDICAVVDKNAAKIGQLGTLPVLAPVDDSLPTYIKNAYIFVTANRDLFEEIRRDIVDVHLDVEAKDIICAHDIHMVAQSACCMEKACAESGKISLRDCYECTNLDNQCISLNTYLKRVNGFEDKGKGTQAVKMIGYALGNICTLKCKNCCESVPYMPQEIRCFVPVENVLKDIDKMCEACNFLTLLEFVGGEPFLHPGFAQILEYVTRIKNIGIIHIFTNGTVIPSDELCVQLRNERITVYLSNYQVSLSDVFLTQVNRAVEKLNHYKVNYFFGKKQNWMDFSGYAKVKEPEELEHGFKGCFLHNCNRLQDGVLYVCPHQYGGIKLGKLTPKEIINIHEWSSEELQKKLEEMKAYKAIDACYYCTMPYKAKTVLSGEQL